jgi:hypothetical protein
MPPTGRPADRRPGEAPAQGAAQPASIKGIRNDQGQTHAKKRSNHVHSPLIHGFFCNIEAWRTSMQLSGL